MWRLRYPALKLMLRKGFLPGGVRIFRKETRRAFNTSYNSRLWQPYRDKLKVYKKAIAIAKKNSWSEFCESINNTRDSARLSKVLAKGHQNPTYVKRDDDSWSESSAESLEILLNTHFPGCKDVTSEDDIQCNRSYSDIGNDIISPERIVWAINSFSPYKSPGLDGILPKMLQSSQSLITPWLLRI